VFSTNRAMLTLFEHVGEVRVVERQGTTLRLSVGVRFPPVVPSTGHGAT
jgi:hypothetical protein